eukprot:m.103277 g.103277  ORF g.103277 m.103277 type:complete len:347 (-) comp12611_c0_seq3:170-1210(-)
MSDQQQNHCVCYQDVVDACDRVKGVAHVTPIITSTTMDKMSGISLFFKCENLQKGGSFKIRGAINAVKLLDPACKDVVTHSSGNHGQALTLAATMSNITAHIVVPDNAPAVKKAAMEDYGADIIVCESTQQAREKTAQETLDRLPNSVFIPPYDFPNVIAGQGTLGLEILDQVEDLDAIIVPVGGGGMLSGIALAVKNKNPKVKVIGAEPELANDTYRSFLAKERLGNPSYPKTVADGVRVDVGELTWPIIRDYVDVVFTVSEKEIIQAQRLVFERMKLVIEPSAGVSVGVALNEKLKGYCVEYGLKRVAVVLCGGNQDIDKLPWVVNPKWDADIDTDADANAETE